VKPTIIIGVEKESAERLAGIGGELASDLGARAVLAHVRADPRPANSSTRRERARHRSRRRGTAVLERACAALPPGLEAGSRFEHGGVASRLSEIAREEGAALIVIGSRGRGPLASAVLGSVSRALPGEAPCPVMIVPDAVPRRSPRPIRDAPRKRATVIASVDSSEQHSVAADFAWALAQPPGERVMMVRTHAAAGSPARALEAISAAEDARMIVISERTLVARLPRLARCPVVVVPEEAAAPLALGETRKLNMVRAA